MNWVDRQYQVLPELPEDRGIVLFTRHSIREQASNGMPGFDIPLTPEGVALAEDWGKYLGSRLKRAYSSPSPRCIDTGAAMLAGAVDSNVGIVDWFREPGAYVTDIKLAGKTFKEKGPLEFVNLALADKLPGAPDARVSTRKLLAFLQSVIPEPGGITVCVTHDTVLAAFVYDLIGNHQLQDDDWPEMMEGIFLWTTSDSWHWIWRGEIYHKTHLELGITAPG